VVLQHLLTAEELKEWGWRIPFVIGAIAGLVALYLRKSLAETLSEESRSCKDAGTFSGVMKHKGAFLTIIGFTAGGSLAFYTYTTYMQKYLVNTVGIPASTANIIMTGALLVFMVMQPFFGALSDKIGRRTNILWFFGLAMLMTVPLLSLLKIPTLRLV
jgi:MFS transporter, MHS family, alpha-ketoglutarate permease